MAKFKKSNKVEKLFMLFVYLSTIVLLFVTICTVNFVSDELNQINSNQIMSKTTVE